MTAIPTICTISDLINLSGSQYRVFDIGRRIDKISKSQFEKIELNQLAYPYPIQGHACIALTFWQKQSDQRFLWFVKLPLDERGLLNQGARDHFIAIIIEALGTDVTRTATQHQEELLKNNPYHFTPSPYKLAALNSIINHQLKQPPSSYLDHCQDYISGMLGWHNWHQVGVQGLTDFACRLDNNTQADSLVKALPHLPEQVLAPMCSALENQPLSTALIDSLLTRIGSAGDCETAQIQPYLIRALGASTQHKNLQCLLDLPVFEHHISHEVLIAIASRCWLLLESPQNMMKYLELLIKQQDQALFNALFRDLVAIPKIRPVVFTCMRDPNRSAALAKGIGALFNQGN